MTRSRAFPRRPTARRTPNFKPNTTGDARVLFTSRSTTPRRPSYFDPITQQSTTIVPAIDSLNTKRRGPADARQRPRLVALGRHPDRLWRRPARSTRRHPLRRRRPQRRRRYATPTPVPCSSPARAPFGFIPGQGFVDPGQRHPVDRSRTTTSSTTGDAPISITPDGLLAADTLRPLSSGAPFFRGNIFQRQPGGQRPPRRGHQRRLAPGRQRRRQLALGQHRPDLHRPRHDRAGRPRTSSGACSRRSARTRLRPRSSPSPSPRSCSPSRAPCPARSWPTARPSHAPASR